MRMKWDETGERLYETGTKKGVVYPQVDGRYPVGYPWNGLTAFTMSPDGADVTDLYADDIKYVSLRSRENFKATIEAYTYPDEFAACDGSATVDGVPGVYLGQQTRKPFGFSCVTSIGNDTDFEDHGYKLHLVWGATADPSERSYETQSDDPDAIKFSWEISTLPVPVTGFKPLAHMEIDSTKATPAYLAILEDILYGSDTPVYTKTSDESKQNGKTYYTQDGTSPNFTYTEFTGNSFAANTDYYEQVTPGPWLPMPDEVLQIMRTGQISG